MKKKRILSFVKLTERLDAKFLDSVAYRITHAEGHAFDVVLRRPLHFQMAHGIVLAQMYPEVIVLIGENCRPAHIASFLGYEIAERKCEHVKRDKVEKFCSLLEMVCGTLSIAIEEKRQSASSETVYYRLCKDERRCQVRVSYHEKTYEIYNLELVLFDFAVHKHVNPLRRLERLITFFRIPHKITV
ncbi:MAG: hypothetical protein WDN09_01185 [bacterium]